MYSEESSTDGEVRNAESKSFRNWGLRLEKSKGQQYKILQKEQKQEKLFYWFWELILHKCIRIIKLTRILTTLFFYFRIWKVCSKRGNKKRDYVMCKTSKFCSKNWIIFLPLKEISYMMLSKSWKSNFSKLRSVSVSVI